MRAAVRRNIEAAEDSSSPPRPSHALQRHGPVRSRPTVLRIFPELEDVSDAGVAIGGVPFTRWPRPKLGAAANDN